MRTCDARKPETTGVIDWYASGSTRKQCSNFEAVTKCSLERIERQTSVNASPKIGQALIEDAV
jgi:hypothetical protein